MGAVVKIFSFPKQKLSESHVTRLTSLDVIVYMQSIGLVLDVNTMIELTGKIGPQLSTKGNTRRKQKTKYEKFLSSKNIFCEKEISAVSTINIYF